MSKSCYPPGELLLPTSLVPFKGSVRIKSYKFKPPAGRTLLALARLLGADEHCSLRMCLSKRLKSFSGIGPVSSFMFASWKPDHLFSFLFSK